MQAIWREEPAVTRNPLDVVEEIVAAHDWVHDRAGRDELYAEVDGRWCTYRLLFFWQVEISALQFALQVDMRVPRTQRSPVYELMGVINDKLWLGHFDLDADDGTPTFRHTTLLRGARGASVEQLEDLVDIALVETERFYPAFQFVIWGGKSAEEAIAAAILDTVAEA
jgi:hypothetical protein